MSNSIAPSLRAWGLFSAQPGRASGREPVPDSDGRRRSAWSSTDSSFRPRAPWRHGAGRARTVLADVDAHVRGDASAPGGEEHRSPGRRFCLFLMASPSVRCWRAVRAVPGRRFRERHAGPPLQSKPSEASSPPHRGADGFGRLARRVRAGWGRWVLAPRRPLRLARAWVVVDSEAWAAPGIQDRVSARRGRTAGRQGGEGRFGLSRRRCHCVTSGNRSGRHGLARGCGTLASRRKGRSAGRSSPALQHYCNGIKFHYICRAMQHPDRAIVTSFAE